MTWAYIVLALVLIWSVMTLRLLVRGFRARLAERRQFHGVVLRFVAAFEAVFGDDWDYTRAQIDDPIYIDPYGTFLDPAVDDPRNNWANRGQLLDAYRDLAALLPSRGQR